MKRRTYKRSNEQNREGKETPICIITLMNVRNDVLPNHIEVKNVISYS